MWKRKLPIFPALSATLLRIRAPRSSTFNFTSFNSVSQFSIVFSSLRELFSSTTTNLRTLGPPFLEQGISLFSCNTRNPFSSESTEKFRCWNCNATASTTPFLFCHSCGTVQPPDHSVDYFQIFGLERNYEIKEENLERTYKDWQKKLHPDLVHSKSEREKEYAAEQSSRVIDAYRTLTDPLARATYILKLAGVHVDEEERISDPELLHEIMEIRESVEEAMDSHALHQIQTQVWGKFKHWAKSFCEAFQNRHHEEAVLCIRRMTYYKRANEEIIKKL